MCDIVTASQKSKDKNELVDQRLDLIEGRIYVTTRTVCSWDLGAGSDTCRQLNRLLKESMTTVRSDERGPTNYRRRPRRRRCIDVIRFVQSASSSVNITRHVIIIIIINRSHLKAVDGVGIQVGDGE